MKTPAKILIIALVVLAAIAAVALRDRKGPGPASGEQSGSTKLTANSAQAPEAGTALNANLPRLLDLGAGKCVPCKLMKPILEELKRDYAHAFITEFIDVWENREAGKLYGIEAIPTQIFYDAEGNELFRHTGFYGKEDILGKWKELGITFPAPSARSEAPAK